MGEVIRAVRVGRVNSRTMRLSGVRGMRFPSFDGSGFHIILRCTPWLITENGEPVALRPGDVVLTPSGTTHGLNQTPCELVDLPPAVLESSPPKPGPFFYEQHGAEGVFCLYEIYDDTAAFREHLTTEHVHRFFTALAVYSPTTASDLYQLVEVPAD